MFIKSKVMAIVRGNSTSASNSSTTALVLPSLNATGNNTVILSIYLSGGGLPSSITDSDGDTYVLVGNTSTSASYISIAITASSNKVITINRSSSSWTVAVAVLYSGVDTVTPTYDVGTDSNSGTDASVVVTPTNANDAIISCCNANNGDFSPNYGTGQTEVLRENLSNTWASITEELLAGVSADTQSINDGNLFDDNTIVSFALKADITDITAPVLSTAIVENAAKANIVLTYDEALDTGSTPATGDFTVSGGKTVTGVVVSGSIVTVTVNSDYANGDTITISYTKGANPIQDIAGNDAINLVSQAVTNNIAGSIPEIHIGKWTKGTTSLLPTTSWVSPNNLFSVEERNDSSAYLFTSASSKVKLPATNLADGYLIIGAFEFEDSSNGRHNPTAKFIQSSGTGSFVSGFTSGYNRDNSEDRSYVRTWAFIDSPSAAAEFEFQWRRDSDVPGGGTVRSEFQIISLYYNDVGIYSSIVNNSYGGITPNQVTGMLSTLEGTNITRTGEVITVTGNSKRYLVLGSWYIQGFGSQRSQRWGGLRIDNIVDESVKSYGYVRNAANDRAGELFTHLLETDTNDIDLDLVIHRGAGVLSGQGGADHDGGGTITQSNHCLVVLELKDGCEVFQSTGSTNQNFATTGPVDVQLTKVADININDTSSFIRSSDIGMNAEVGMNGLFGANISVASQDIATGQRWTAFSEFTIDGVESINSVAGDYSRNNQGTTDTFGWSANLLGYETLDLDEDIGISVTELPGSEGGGGSQNGQAGWSSLWGINLDTMNTDGGSSPSLIVGVIDSSSDVTGLLISKGKLIASITPNTNTVSVLIGKGTLSSTINTSSLVDGDLTTGVSISLISVVVNGITTTTAILVSKGILQAVLNSISTVDGEPSARGLLETVINTDSNLTSQLTSKGSLDSTITTSSDLTVTLNALGVLETVINTDSNVIADLTSGVSLGFIQGVINLLSSTEGILKATGTLSGIIENSTTTVSVIIADTSLQVSIDTFSDLTSVLKAKGNLILEINSFSLVNGDIVSNISIEGSISTSSNVTGIISAINNINIEINTTSNVVGTLGSGVELVVAINTFSNIEGVLIAKGELSGVIDNSTTTVSVVVGDTSLESIINTSSNVVGIISAKGNLLIEINTNSSVNGTILLNEILEGIINTFSSLEGNLLNRKLLISGIVDKANTSITVIITNSTPILPTCFHEVKYISEIYSINYQKETYILKYIATINIVTYTKEMYDIKYQKSKIYPITFKCK